MTFTRTPASEDGSLPHIEFLLR